MSGEIHEALRKWEGSLRMRDDIKEPEKLPPLSGPVAMADGTVIEQKEDVSFELLPNGYARFIKSKDEKPQRGSVLQEAINTINGERQDVYGSPEDSFALIGQYWGVYLQSQGYDMREDVCDSGEVLCIEPEEVAMMMTLFKVAREANQHKRDNIVDAAGYLGIYADMQGEG